MSSGHPSNVSLHDLHVPFCDMSDVPTLAFLSSALVLMILLGPLYVSILLLGLRREAAPTHADVLTFHLLLFELVGVAGAALCLAAVLTSNHAPMTAASFFLTLAWYAQSFIHSLTCAERYLAAVRPTAYLRLKGERGARVRNAAVAGVWLLSLAGAGLAETGAVFLVLPQTVACVTVIGVCSLAVFRVLIRRGPGRGGGAGATPDRTKRRAFHNLVAIATALQLKFVWNLTWALLYLRQEADCALLACELLFSVPCSLVAPLLFLYRAGMLPCGGNATT